MYFKHPDKSLFDSLYLITSNNDVLYMVASHIGHFIVHVYIVSLEKRLLMNVMKRIMKKMMKREEELI